MLGVLSASLKHSDGLTGSVVNHRSYFRPMFLFLENLSLLAFALYVLSITVQREHWSNVTTMIFVDKEAYARVNLLPEYK